MYIIKSSENKSLEEIGIKAAALNHMKKLNLNVPEYVIISSKFSEDYFSSIKEKINFILQEFDDVEEISRRIQKIIDETEIMPSLIQQLQIAIDELKKFNIENVEGKLRLVLRSSKPYISGLDSKVFFNVQNVLELEKNIREIFKEHFSVNAINERKSKEQPLLHFNIPLILQKMIIPDVTGIIFPIPERENFYYIVAWKGFGYEMDFFNADHYVVNHKDLLLEKLLNNKPGKIVFFDESADSITVREVLYEEENEPFLTQDQIIDLCEVYSLNKDNLGGLALEFKVKNNVLYFISMKDSKIYHKAKEALEELEKKSKKETLQKTQLSESTDQTEAVEQTESTQIEKTTTEESAKEETSISLTQSLESTQTSQITETQQKPQTLHSVEENNIKDYDVYFKNLLERMNRIEEKLDFILKNFFNK